MLRHTASLTAHGFHPQTLATRVRQGSLHKVRRGVYADDPTPEGAAGHLRMIEATMPLLDPDSVLSHHSAAVIHSLPVWVGSSTPVTVARPGIEKGWSSRHVKVRGTRLRPDEIADSPLGRVTSLERTICDHCRFLPMRRAVMVMDAGLRAGADADEIDQIVLRSAGLRGVPTLRAAVEFADPRAENPGESLSRVVLHDLGLPTPELQSDIHCPHTGQFLGRADFAWDEERVIGEFDGRVKYAGDYGDPSAVIMAEKDREQNLRAAGWAVIRWSWADLQRPERIRARWDAAVRR